MRLSRSDSGAARADALVRRHRRTLVALAVPAVVVVLVGLVLAKAGVLPRVSWTDVLAARERFPGAVLDAAGAVAFLAKPVVAALTVLGASAAALVRFGPRWSGVVLAAALVTAVAAVLKHAVGPATSLPSGHAAYAAAVFGAMAWLTLAEGRLGARSRCCWRASRWRRRGSCRARTSRPTPSLDWRSGGHGWRRCCSSPHGGPRSPTDHIARRDAAHPP